MCWGGSVVANSEVLKTLNSLNNKISNPGAYVTETYSSGTTKRRVWSDGFKEEWYASPDLTKNYTFTNAYTEKPMVFITGINFTNANEAGFEVGVVSLTKTKCSVVVGEGSSGTHGYFLYACGK